MKGYFQLNLDSHTKTLVKYLCTQVIESIIRVNNFDLVIESTQEGYDIEPDEFEGYFASQLYRFKYVYNNPDDIFILEEGDLSIFKHVLTTYCYEVLKWKKSWIKLWTIFELQEELIAWEN